MYVCLKHTARRSDGRWSTRSLVWTPVNGSRKVGHPVHRWSDDLATFHLKVFGKGVNWLSSAQDRETWKLLQAGFVDNSI